MSGVVVVDASFAIKWGLTEAHTAEARAHLIDWERGQVSRLVPALFLSEILTPLLRLRRQGLISLAEAERVRGDLVLAVTVQPEDDALSARSLTMADELSLRFGYDTLYAALAEREGCDLWTADEEFWKVARRRFPWIHFVTEPQGT